VIPHLKNFISVYLPDREAMAPVAPRELALWPVNMKWVQIQEPSRLVASVIDEVLDLSGSLQDRDLSFADVTLLVRDNAIGTACLALLGAAGIDVKHVFGAGHQEQKERKLAFHAGDRRMKAATIHSFKGWESRVIVLAIDYAPNQGQLSALYVALSRVKRHPSGSCLVVVCADPALVPYGRTWPDFKLIDREESSAADDPPLPF